MTTKSKLLIGITFLGIVIIFGYACSQQSTPPVIYSVPELKYILFSNFEDLFYVDPDLYPIERPGQEEKNASEQFTNIKTNDVEFSVILEHLGLQNKSEYTDEEKLLIYREHKKLTRAVEITDSGNIYNFSLLVREGQGERIEGTITPAGKIKVLKREPSFNTYPICLTKGTLIDTPNGPIPVEQMDEGMTVWTINDSGDRITGTIVKTVITPVPPDFQVVRLGLIDGRTVTASPGHPTFGGRPLGKYQVGDTLDGARLVAIERIVYDGEATHDFLPDSTTSLYWANGILLKSTLAKK